MSFIDKCTIEFIAGNGGDGLVAWRREAHVPMGGPAGGNGGNGGNIIIVGDHNESNLNNLRYLRKITAENGGNGAIKTMHGKNGKDIYVKVPLGTVLIDLKTNKQLVDIKHDLEQYVLCHGGAGGKGNFNFKSNYNKAPSLYELGDLGEIKQVQLELKHIADIGIVGLPNAGKSTFISMITHAKPKIANYQFTTLKPVLGTYYSNNKKIVFADIPGLISGASEGHGLGHDFLKHIERTKVLIHIISMSDIDNDDVVESYQTIIDEMNKFSPKILKHKPMIVVANKNDCEMFEANFKKLSTYLKGANIHQVSTLNGDNLDNVVIEAINLLNAKSKKNTKKTEVKVIDNSSKLNNLSREMKITKLEDHVFEVECEFLMYWSHKIPLTTQDNAVRFNQKLKTVNFEENLKKAGAITNDTIKLYKLSLNFEE